MSKIIDIPNSAGSLIKQARMLSQLTQSEFSEIFGVDQSLLSKYENDKINPPSNLIMHCMHIFLIDSKRVMDSDDRELNGIVSLVKLKLSGDGKQALREAIKTLLIGIS